MGRNIELGKGKGTRGHQHGRLKLPIRSLSIKLYARPKHAR